MTPMLFPLRSTVRVPHVAHVVALHCDRYQRDSERKFVDTAFCVLMGLYTVSGLIMLGGAVLLTHVLKTPRPPVDAFSHAVIQWFT